MAQDKKVELDTPTKFTYADFCKMMKRFNREEEKKSKKEHSNLGYIPMKEYKRLKPKNQIKGK